MSDLCILVSVYHPYKWVADFTHRFMDRFWPDHPPLFFCGLTSEEAGDLPHIPCRDKALPRSWAKFVRDACEDLAARGYKKCYFLLEDHPPLGPCHVGHLNETLPELLDVMGAAYIGLMGWDNRRFLARGPVLANGLMHLTASESPRFHLHPSLFRLDVLTGCLDLLLQQKNQTPWGFEKTCDKADNSLPEEWKQGCYQIRGEDLAVHPSVGLGRLLRTAERKFYHRAMSLVPVSQKLGLGMAFWDALGYDDFFYNGPYPMFYAGVMSRGKVNPFLLKYLERHKSDSSLQELIAASKAQGAA